jgi:hypothetical protein
MKWQIYIWYSLMFKKQTMTRGRGANPPHNARSAMCDVQAKHLVRRTGPTLSTGKGKQNNGGTDTRIRGLEKQKQIKI